MDIPGAAREMKGPGTDCEGSGTDCCSACDGNGTRWDGQLGQGLL